MSKKQKMVVTDEFSAELPFWFEQLTVGMNAEEKLELLVSFLVKLEVTFRKLQEFHEQLSEQRSESPPASAPALLATAGGEASSGTSTSSI